MRSKVRALQIVVQELDAAALRKRQEANVISKEADVVAEHIAFLALRGQAYGEEQITKFLPLSTQFQRKAIEFEKLTSAANVVQIMIEKETGVVIDADSPWERRSYRPGWIQITFFIDRQSSQFASRRPPASVRAPFSFFPLRTGLDNSIRNFF